MRYIVAFITLIFAACGVFDKKKKEEVPQVEPKAEQPFPCVVTDAPEGVTITCGGTTAFIPKPQDGKDGVNGKDGANGRDGKDGSNGVDGKDGSNGVDGKDGQSCIVSKSDIGTEIQCGDNVAFIPNPVNGRDGLDGVDGKDGIDGQSCLVSSDTTGVTVTCPNGVAFIPLAKDGKDGTDGANGQDGVDGQSCTAQDTPTGALIVCGQEMVVVKDGKDGTDGQDGQDAVKLEPIDPCGDAKGLVDEVLFQYGKFVFASYSDDVGGTNTRLSIVPDGTFMTTDGSRCVFTVSKGVVSW